MRNQAPYDYNTAKLPAGTEDVYNAENLGGEKETIGSLLYLVPLGTKKECREVLDARFYMGRSNSAHTVYCSVWIRTKAGRTLTGRGQAGGYGYHKRSAALDAAIRSAGIDLEKPIHGCGDGAMREAAKAIAKAAGYGRNWAHVVER